MRVFVDTSAVLALLDEDDRRHAEASRAFRALAPAGELVTHNYVHVEALAVARRRLGVAAADRLVDALFPVIRTVWVDEPVHRAALAAYRAAPGPSLTDHVSFAVMRLEGIDIAFAFDRDFQTAGFGSPSVTEPQARTPRIGESPPSYGRGLTDASELVSVAEIAIRAARPVNTVQSWRRRHADFPSPVASLAAGPVWTWAEVERWISRRPVHRTRSTAA